jgi:hypothetical protein
MEVYHKVEQEMMPVVVDRVMYLVEERLLAVLIVVHYLYDYLLWFEELEYNHHLHIEEVYNHYYPIQMDQRHTKRI